MIATLGIGGYAAVAVFDSCIFCSSLLACGRSIYPCLNAAQDPHDLEPENEYSIPILGLRKVLIVAKDYQHLSRIEKIKCTVKLIFTSMAAFLVSYGAILGVAYTIGIGIAPYHFLARKVLKGALMGLGVDCYIRYKCSQWDPALA